MFPPLVERWRVLARQIAPDLPVSLVLAVIQVESGGITGRRSSLGIDDYGLMQTKPSHLPGWNAEHPGDPITVAQLTGSGIDDAKAQIKLGTSYLRKCLNAVHGWNNSRWTWRNTGTTITGTLEADQIQFSDLCYSAGINGARRFRLKALKAGFPDTLEGLETYNPHWGGLRPRRRFNHARKVAALWASDGTSTGGHAAPLPTVSTTTPAAPNSTALPGIALLVFGFLASRAFQK